MKMNLISSRVYDFTDAEGRPVHFIQVFLTHEWNPTLKGVKGLCVEKRNYEFGTPLFDKLSKFEPPCMVECTYQIYGSKAVISDISLIRS